MEMEHKTDENVIMLPCFVLDQADESAIILSIISVILYQIGYAVLNVRSCYLVPSLSSVNFERRRKKR